MMKINKKAYHIPADSFPTTKVTGVECCMAFLRAALAETRNDLRETRGRDVIFT